MLEGVLTVDDVADLLRVSRHTVYRLAQRGELPGRKIGRIWRFPRRAVEQYLSFDQHRVDCDSESAGHGEDVGSHKDLHLESPATTPATTSSGHVGSDEKT